MENVYWFCAVVGTTILVCQFLMTLIGIGGDHGDADAGGHDLGGDAGGHDGFGDAADHHGGEGGHEPGGHAMTNWLFGVLTFRTLTAAAAFFGLAGMAAGETLEPSVTLVIALAAGATALFLVSSIMRWLGKLGTDGTIRIRHAVGATGTVYVPVPAGKAGAGKVHVGVRGRSIEYKAITSYGALPTGARVVVVGVVGSDTVEVSPAESVAPAHQG